MAAILLRIPSYRYGPFGLLAVAATLTALAGCGGSSKPLAQRVVVSGDMLTMPDGSTIKLTIYSGDARCAILDDPTGGLFTINKTDVTATGWEVTVGC